MEGDRFDDLTRLIAGKTSRRQVLKMLAGAAVGGFFGSRLSPALAAGEGNSACAHFCN
jgi:outer membrane lipoprotein SlyB